MANPLAIRRTLIAGAKLEEIYEFSCENWGVTVAQKYLSDIECAIQQAAIDRGGLKRNPKFSKRFTYSNARKHLVFFDVKKDTLFVATIFHGVMNIKEGLAEEMGAIQREISQVENSE